MENIELLSEEDFVKLSLEGKKKYLTEIVLQLTPKQCSFVIEELKKGGLMPND